MRRKRALADCESLPPHAVFVGLPIGLENALLFNKSSLKVVSVQRFVARWTYVLDPFSVEQMLQSSVKVSVKINLL